MSVSPKLWIGTGVGGVCCLLVGLAWAQQPNQASPPGNIKPSQYQGGKENQLNQPGAQRGQNIREDRAIRTTSAVGSEGQDQELNRQIAACLLDQNKAEVEFGKLAADRAENKEVKEFAQQIVKDHSDAVQKLEKIVGQQAPNDRRSQIEHQINERCAKAFREELESRSGKEFDACYIGSQIGGHMHMNAALEVLADNTTGDLQQLVNDMQPTVEKHLKHAQQLMKDSDSRQAGRDRSETNR